MKISILPDIKGSSIKQYDIPWSELCRMVGSPVEYPSKEKQPLIKLATFGEQRSINGSLRHDGNVLSVSGVEADYDDGLVSLQQAELFLQVAGIKAVICTTSSYTDAKPRWRVLLPFSEDKLPNKRAGYVARLNMLLGGILASESLTLSQSFYLGKVKGTPYHSIIIDGGFIDELYEPIVIEKQVVVPGDHVVVDDTILGELESALKSISSDDRDTWISVGQALSGLGESGYRLWAEWSATSDKHNPDQDLWRWNTFAGSRTGHQSVFAKAQANGWTNPRAAKTLELAAVNWNATVPSIDGNALDAIDINLLSAGTQDTLSLLFEKHNQGKLLYDHTRNVWLEWDGTRWRIEPTKKAFDMVRDLARQMNLHGKKNMSSCGFAAGVECFAKASRAFATRGDEFDRDNYLLNTPGGTFDLRTNTLRQHNPDDRLTKTTLVTPNSEGSGVVFEKFLDEITIGDLQMREFLQVSLGAVLSGAIESHWMLFWIGAGRNGKNTLGDLVRDVMGGYAKKIQSSVLLSTNSEKHDTEIANLKGTRLAVASEIPDGSFWNEARINEFTGDSSLSGRFMRGDFFEFDRTHKHLVFGNHRPQLRVTSDGIRSRMKIVRFAASFIGREDAELPRKLRVEAPYVLAWLIEGHNKWLKAGRRLPKCDAVEAETDEYFAAQSTVEMWIDECCEVLAVDMTPTMLLPTSSFLYRNYFDWKKGRGEQPVSNGRWCDSMNRFERLKSGVFRYRGIKLKSIFQ